MLECVCVTIMMLEKHDLLWPPEVKCGQIFEFRVCPDFTSRTIFVVAYVGYCL
jgi:hypothetical protein